MPLPMICGGLSFLALIVLWIALRDRGIDRNLCSAEHRFGPARYTHYAAIECPAAELVASWAAEIWEELREEFPAETELDFTLELILDPAEGEGRVWFQDGVSYAVVNLCGINLDITHPAYLEGEGRLRATISEELHHLVWFRNHGWFDYLYEFDPESRDREMEEVLYYALNEHETEALRFVVRATGEREELLEQVDEYLASRLSRFGR